MPWNDFVFKSYAKIKHTKCLCSTKRKLHKKIEMWINFQHTRSRWTHDYFTLVKCHSTDIFFLKKSRRNFNDTRNHFNYSDKKIIIWKMCVLNISCVNGITKGRHTRCSVRLRSMSWTMDSCHQSSLLCHRFKDVYEANNRSRNISGKKYILSTDNEKNEKKMKKRGK